MAKREGHRVSGSRKGLKERRLAHFGRCSARFKEACRRLAGSFPSNVDDSMKASAVYGSTHYTNLWNPCVPQKVA